MGTPHVVRQAQWLMLAAGVALMPAGLAAALFAAVMPRSKRSWLGPRDWLFTEVAFTWFLDRYLFRRRRPQLPPVPDLNYTPPPLRYEPGFVRAVASQTGYGRPVLSALDACVCARAASARGPRLRAVQPAARTGMRR